jgi:hypothetical protein
MEEHRKDVLVNMQTTAAEEASPSLLQIHASTLAALYSLTCITDATKSSTTPPFSNNTYFAQAMGSHFASFLQKYYPPGAHHIGPLKSVTGAYGLFTIAFIHAVTQRQTARIHKLADLIAWRRHTRFEQYCVYHFYPGSRFWSCTQVDMATPLRLSDVLFIRIDFLCAMWCIHMKEEAVRAMFDDVRAHFSFKQLTNATIRIADMPLEYPPDEEETESTPETAEVRDNQYLDVSINKLNRRLWDVMLFNPNKNYTPPNPFPSDDYLRMNDCGNFY